jgi:hypothetical protein
MVTNATRADDYAAPFEAIRRQELEDGPMLRLRALQHLEAAAELLRAAGNDTLAAEARGLEHKVQWAGRGGK